MALPAEKQLHSLDEYFSLTDQEGEIRYEYYFGKIVAMAGALLRHNLVAGNAFGLLYTQLRKKKCTPFNSDNRLRVNPQMWVYPDVMVSCHDEDLAARLYINHPSLIIEVLSESTRNVDYTLKRQYYLQIPDLQYYILIESDRIFVDVYERKEDFWANKIYTETDDIISLPFIGVELAIEDLYERVTFEE